MRSRPQPPLPPLTEAQARWHRRGFYLGFFGILALLIAAASQSPSPPPKDSQGGDDQRMIGRPKVHIAYFQWRKGGFDSVMIADFQVDNDNPYSVRDIEIRCHVSGESGTVIGWPSKTIYRRIQPHTSTWFMEESMGFISSQAAAADCEIGLVTAEKPK